MKKNFHTGKKISEYDRTVIVRWVIFAWIVGKKITEGNGKLIKCMRLPSDCTLIPIVKQRVRE